MLVVTRKAGQEIAIGGDIKIQIVSVNQHGQVRVGVIAPDDVKIRRPEARAPMPPDDQVEELKE
jgi:carbon storage regulator CsrA